ncbi:short chain dehydrogenase [Aureobasidium pullulans]|uniref:2,4-dienoyl-CoA reductase [(3E)-enoyl-CoA-producing] n=1 Tax=Aureobasidium pullulans TaxID=5580 RepID=A0AB74K7V3_AURPU|nr:short chain dehydrogenase [Aureobasidium pullulans]THX40614.1 short chain dehydrogenase [Aureobasidium pullulans]
MPQEKKEYLSEAWKDGIFKDKVLFCTGGAGSICSAQTRALVHLGASAAIIGRNKEKTERMAAGIATARPGARVLAIAGVDVRDPKALQDAADRTARELGGIDFVIAGAAGNFLAPMSQLSANAFKSVIDIDVLGSYNTVKATLPHLVKSAKSSTVDATTPSAGGRIIFVSATIHYTGLPLQTHVSAAKAAVDALSNAVAIEYGPLGVTSNVIAPGPIGGTEGMERLAKSDPNSVAKSAKRVPLGRLGSVKDIADATVYLFSDAGNFVNGSTVVVDGGSWRVNAGGPGSTWEYPDFILSGAAVEGVKGGKAKL